MEVSRFKLILTLKILIFKSKFQKRTEGPPENMKFWKQACSDFENKWQLQCVYIGFRAGTKQVYGAPYVAFDRLYRG